MKEISPTASSGIGFVSTSVCLAVFILKIKVSSGTPEPVTFIPTTREGRMAAGTLLTVFGSYSLTRPVNVKLSISTFPLVPFAE